MTTAAAAAVTLVWAMSIPPAVVHPAARHRWSGLADAWGRVRRSPFAFDVALAVVMALVTWAGSVAESHPGNPGDKPPPGVHIAAPPAAYLLVVVSALALIWRRRRPVLVLAVSLGAALLYICLGYFGGAVMLNPMFALYAVAVAVAVPTARAIALAVITMLSLMAATAAFGPFGTGGGFAFIPGEVAAALFLGLRVASRHAALRESAEQARRAVDAERLRIARELHDVVAHTMSTINVQAGVAAHVIDRQPEQAAQALEAIKQASKEGLRELARHPQRPTPGRRAGRALAGTAPGAARRTRRERDARGPAYFGDDPGTGTGVGADGRPHCLPDRAGVADQRPAPCRSNHCQRDALLQR